MSLLSRNKDKGFTVLQIYYLTHKVSNLSSHLELHPKDYSSQRGLWKLLGRRKSLLVYLSNENTVLYTKLLKNLNIRGLKGR